VEALDDAVGLRRMVEDGPTPAIHGVVRWRIVDLCQWLFEEFRISVSEMYKLILDLTDGVSWPLSLQAAWLSSPLEAT